MKFKNPLSLKETADLLGCRFVGDPNHKITGINEIHQVESGDLVFVDHPKYYDKALNSAATTVLIDKEVDCPEGKGLLISESPFDDFNFLTRQHSPFQQWNEAISSDLVKGEGTIIHPNVTIGKNVVIGNNCMIHSGAVIFDNTVIGNNVVINANCVIGGDAFYYKKKATGYDRMHTCGRVVLEDRVEVGALSSIDAGVTGDTFVGEGTKLDNQVHIGHDTYVGKGCLFAAQVGIAGCVTIHDNVTLWGQVGVPSDIVIGEGAVVLGQSGIMKSIEGGKTYFGSPAGEARVKYRELAAIKKLPVIMERL